MSILDDQEALASLRRLYLGLTPGECTVQFVGERLRGRRVGILPSSFNPPTEAHLALAEAGRAQLSLGGVVLSYGRVILDKAPSGLAPEDRLAALVAIAEARRGYAVAVPAVGLYAEMARAYQTALPGVQLFFLVGFDKAEQIFDPRYYSNRDAALGELFSRARLGVAPRAGQGPDALHALLEQPENQPFAPYVTPLQLDARFSEVSSTRLRAALAHDDSPREEDDEALSQIPAELRAWLPALGAFDADRSHYEARLAQLPPG